MTIKLLFFGALTDIIGEQQQNVSLDEAMDVVKLDTGLKLKHPSLSHHNYKIAVNQQLVNNNRQLKDGDEVAFLPPFAGG